MYNTLGHTLWSYSRTRCITAALRFLPTCAQRIEKLLSPAGDWTVSAGWVLENRIKWNKMFKIKCSDLYHNLRKLLWLKKKSSRNRPDLWVSVRGFVFVHEWTEGEWWETFYHLPPEQRDEEMMNQKWQTQINRTLLCDLCLTFSICSCSKLMIFLWPSTTWLWK